MYFDEDYIDWDKEDVADIGLFYDGDPDRDNTSIVPLCSDCAADGGFNLMVDSFGQHRNPYRCIACERPNRAEVKYEAKRKKEE